VTVRAPVLREPNAVLRESRESAELVREFFEMESTRITSCARTLADRFQKGGRLFTMGNGGSYSDAQHVAVEFQHPILEKRKALPAQALGAEGAFLTAVGNDTDFGRVFVEALEVHARPQDAVIGISTSGTATNVVNALRHARHGGLFTIGFAGRDGGAVADVAEVPFVVPSWSIHRIQEVHTVLLHVLWDQVHLALGEDDVL
jgi:D-sedoheptulose 7-phosphate isomerase